MQTSHKFFQSKLHFLSSSLIYISLVFGEFSCIISPHKLQIMTNCRRDRAREWQRKRENREKGGNSKLLLTLKGKLLMKSFSNIRLPYTYNQIKRWPLPCVLEKNGISGALVNINYDNNGWQLFSVLYCHYDKVNEYLRPVSWDFLHLIVPSVFSSCASLENWIGCKRSCNDHNCTAFLQCECACVSSDE